MAGLFEFLFGSGDKPQKIPTMTGSQKNFLSSILGQLGGMQGPSSSYGLAQQRLQEQLMGGNEAYDAFAAPYMRQFQEQLVPQLAERFAGAGALSSSSFGQALGSAGAGLQEQLASLRANQQQGAIQNAFGQYNTLAGLGLGAQPFGIGIKGGQSGFIPGLIGGGVSGLMGGGYGTLANLLGFGGR